MVLKRLDLEAIKEEPQNPEEDGTEEETHHSDEEEPLSSEALEEEPETSEESEGSTDSWDVSLDWAEINTLIGEPDSSFALPSSSDSD